MHWLEEVKIGRITGETGVHLGVKDMATLDRLTTFLAECTIDYEHDTASGEGCHHVLVAGAENLNKLYKFGCPIPAELSHAIGIGPRSGMVKH